jgi:hypothetical protein
LSQWALSTIKASRIPMRSRSVIIPQNRSDAPSM